MMQDLQALLFFLAALIHLFFFVYNRYLLCIKEGRWKRPILHLWLLGSVVFPFLTVLALWDVPAVRQALGWRPASLGAAGLFVAVAGLQAFFVARALMWLGSRIFPDRPGALLSREVRKAGASPVAPRLPPLVRQLETTGELVVTRMEVAVGGLAPAFDGLTVVQVSDVHYGRHLELENYLESAAQCVARLQPDIVVLTGDLVERRRDIRRAVEYHSKFAGRLATLAVLGNHDYWTDPDRIRRELAKTHIAWLGGGERRILKRAGRRLIFTGTDAPWNNQRSADWRRLIRREAGDAVVLLSHTPDNAPEAARHGASLILSGHNHGGQYCLPLFGPFIVPSRYGLRYPGGVYRVGPESTLVVSRGIGVSEGGARMLCPPEICHLTLRPPAVDVMVGEAAPAVRRRVLLDRPPAEEEVPKGSAWVN